MEISVKRIEVLENEINELKKIIDEFKIILKFNDKNCTGYADIYQYKNSLILVSKSKELGTYNIKDKLKSIGAKWTTVLDKNGSKFSGWLILGICKVKNIDEAIQSIINDLSKINCTLTFNNKGKIEPVEIPITTM